MTERLGVGTVLATSARIWGRNLPRLLAIVVVLFLPYIAWSAMQVSDGMEHVIRSYYRFTSDLGPLSTLPSGLFLVHAVATAAVTHAVAVALTGPPVPIGRSARTAVRRFLPVLGVALVVRVATWAVMAALVGLVAMSLGSGGVQGLIVAAAAAVMRYLFYLAVPVATAERPGPFRAIVRGFQLARGAQLRVFAIVLITQILTGLAFQLALTVLRPDFAAGPEGVRDALRIFIVVNFGISLLVFSFTSVVNAVTYWRLRELKEGPSSDKLATIFD
jgi:hypothetical protein